MSSVRLRRLTADYDKLKEYARLHPRVRLIQADGDPPERYQLEYRISSVRMDDDGLQGVKSHLVEIVLSRNYPRSPPQCRMLTPVFHPNIAPHAICVGDHWSAGEPLASIVIRIGELLAYQVYNVKSPLNGEAARWVEQNQQKLPLDPVSLLVEEESTATDKTNASAARQPGSPARPAGPPAAGPAAGPAAVAARNAETPAATNLRPDNIVVCPACHKRYRFREGLLGHKLCCTKCKNVFTLPDK